MNWGIFQGDSLSSSLIVLRMMPLSMVLRSVKAGCNWGTNEVRTNHALYMDDLIKPFGKIYYQTETLVQIVHISSTALWKLRRCEGAFLSIVLFCFV